MVANALLEPVESGSEISRPRPKNKSSYRNGEIPVLVRVKARNLYLHQSLPYKAISEITGLPVKTLEQLSHRERWPTIRKANYARLAKSDDAHTTAMAEEVVEVMASTSEQHAIRGLDRVGEALERDDRDAAKDFQALTAGVKNLVSVVRLLRDPTATGQQGASATVLNVFIQRTPGKDEAKNVQEIEAKRVQ